MVLSSVISVLFLPCFRILYGTLSILMVRPLEPMVISRRDITEKLSILTLTITSSNINNTSNNNSSSNNITASTTTLTTLTPRSISTTGTGLTSTLTTATDTQYPANQDRDSSLTVSFNKNWLQFNSDNLFFCRLAVRRRVRSSWSLHWSWYFWWTATTAHFRRNFQHRDLSAESRRPGGLLYS